MSAGNTSYQIEKGENPPIIFIHGWLGSKHSWRKIRSNLEIDNTKLFYDLRCHGKSKCTKFDFNKLVEDLNSLIEKLSVEEPVLVGHSMGGMIALKYSVTYKNISGLFLMGTSASTPEPENHSPRFFLEKFGSMDRRSWAIEISKNYIDPEENPELKDNVVRELIEAGDTEIIYSLGSMLSYDVREELEDVDVPAKVVAGKKDGAITLEKSKELAELLDCEIKELNCSHLINHEKPEKTAELLENFISGL